LAWDANKERLREHISTHEQEDYDSYKKIVAMLFEQVINPYEEQNYNFRFALKKIHEIDDGSHSGALMYLIPMDDYEPTPTDYVITYVDYGSCSGCDTLLGILEDIDTLPTASQVEQFMTLCLHILQHCKYPYSYEEWYDSED